MGPARATRVPCIGAYRGKTDLGVLGLSYSKVNGYEYKEDQRSGSQRSAEMERCSVKVMALHRCVPNVCRQASVFKFKTPLYPHFFEDVEVD